MTQLSIILFEPEIPPNTGNIIRLCANSGANLHLIKPLGFKLEDKQLRRAGLDYHEWAQVKIWENWNEALQSFSNHPVFAMTTKGSSNFFMVDFIAAAKKNKEQEAHIILLFGPETRGLPNSILDNLNPEYKLRLPMTENGRSLNLSNTVAIAIYEVWRQFNFEKLN